MDLRAAILKEHSKAQAINISSYVGDDAERFAALMELFLGKETRITQRAAYSVSYCTDKHPELAIPYYPAFIKAIDKEGHIAIKRNALRVLANQDLPEKYWGILADRCMLILADPQEPIAVHRYAMEIVWNICQEVPELALEFKILLEDIMEFSSTGGKNYANKLLKQIRKRGWDEQ